MQNCFFLDSENIHKSQKLKSPQNSELVGTSSWYRYDVIVNLMQLSFMQLSIFHGNYVLVLSCLVCIYLCNVVLYVSVQLIKEGKRYDDLTEVAKLFNLHGSQQVDADQDTEQTDVQATAA